MTLILEKVILWAERQIPEAKSVWISDLRSEAKHIAGRIALWRFLWSGALAALGQVMHVRLGVQRVGQTLLGLAVLAFCLGGLIIGPSIENEVVKITFYAMLPIYALTGGLAILSLSLLKRFSLSFILVLGLFWIIAGLKFFTAMEVPIWFFRAFAVETAVIMSGLFIAASYLSWAEDADYA